MSDKDDQAASAAQAPTVTLAMFAYNQEKFIRDAAISALSQQGSPIEIIFSDDHSSDRTFEILRDIVAGYDGPHHVTLRQEPCNRGLIGHVNAVMAIARSEYVVLAAGDDISAPDRVASLVRAMADRPLLVHSGYDFINEAGQPVAMKRPFEALLSGSLETIAAADALYVGATGCWHRDLFEKYGPIEFAEAYEDLVMGYRAALEGRVAFVDRPLVHYRIGSGTTTRPDVRRNRMIRGCRATIASLQQRLADTRRHFPDRHDLIGIIEKALKKQKIIFIYYDDRARFLRRYSWRPSVQAYFLKRYLALIRRRFGKG